MYESGAGIPTSPAWIAAITALVAALLGPLVTVYATYRQNMTAARIAHAQMQASVVSASRQRWIDDVRATVSEFLAAVAELHYVVKSKGAEAWPEDERAEKIVFLRAKASLLLNPVEDDHQRLLGLMNEMSLGLALSSDPLSIREINRLHHDVTRQAQTILKREWERVKRGEVPMQLTGETSGTGA
jgi:hypothetical protein